MNGLRRLSLKWPPRYEAFNRVRIERGKYYCEECGELLPKRKLEADHINPVIPTNTKSIDLTLDVIVERMLPMSSEDYQILCKPCHKEKSAKENKKRNKEK